MTEEAPISEVQLRVPNRSSRGRTVPDPRQKAIREHRESERLGLIDQAKRLTDLVPNSSVAWSRYAQTLASNGALTEAVDAARRAFESLGDDERETAPGMAAVFVGARVLASAGLLTEAESALSALPRGGAWALMYADLAASRGNYDLALNRIGEPHSAPSQAFAGYLYLVTHQPQRALGLLRSALRNGDNSPSLWLNLAYAYASVGSPAKAIRAAHQATTLSPRSRSSSFNYVSYLRASGRVQEALSELRRLRQARGQDDPLIAAAMAQAYADCGDPAQGLRELRRAQHHNSLEIGSQELAELHANLAALEWKVGKLSRREVVEVLREQISIAGPSISLGVMLADFDSTEMVVPELERIISHLEVQSSREDLEGLERLLMRLQFLRGDLVGAANLSVQFAERNPLDLSEVCTAILFRGQILGEYAEAANMGIAALKRLPADRMLLNNTAFCLTYADRAVEADRMLAHKDFSDDVYLVATRGLVDLALGRTKSGLSRYNEAAQLIQKSAMQQDDRADLLMILRANEAIALTRFCPTERTEATEPVRTAVVPSKWSSDSRFWLLRVAADRFNTTWTVTD